MIHSVLLQNGIRLISEPVEHTEVASIGFWFPYGSRYEKDGIRGVAHFIEHMLFKGTPSRSAFAIAREFDRVGGYVNAFTEREMVCLYCVVPASYAIQALHVFCDMTAKSLFDCNEFEKERTVIETEVISSLDDSEDASQDAIVQAVYPRSSLSYSIAGSVSDVNSLTRDTVYQVYTDFFLNGPLTVTAAGNINPDLFAPVLESELPPRTSNSLPELCEYGTLPKWRSGRFFLPADFKQTQVAWAYPISFPLAHDDYYKWCILDSVVGDTMSSRLFQALREKNGFCYNVYSSFSFARDTGMWSAYAAFAPEKTADAVQMLATEIERLRSGGITDTEFQDAVEHIKGDMMLSAEDSEFRMKRLARQYYFSGTPITLEEEFAYYAKIAKYDIEQLIKDTFISENMALIVFGKKKNLPHGLTTIRKNKDGYYGK